MTGLRSKTNARVHAHHARPLRAREQVRIPPHTMAAVHSPSMSASPHCWLVPPWNSPPMEYCAEGGGDAQGVFQPLRL